MDRHAALGPIPQHQTFAFSAYSVSFSSQFDSGNIGKVEAQGADTFWLWTAPDCANTGCETTCRTWFYFRMEVGQARAYTLVLKNLNQQTKLFREGLRPVFKYRDQPWERFAGTVNWRNDQGNFEVTLQACLESGPCYFAFCPPWSLEESYCLSAQLVAEATTDIYINRVPLIYSPEGRVCELLTISSYDCIDSVPEPKLPCLFPSEDPRAMKFAPDKPVVFISARVHPGETPGSHMLNGFLKFVVSPDPRAVALRKHFVFKVIPVLNPDGVFRGYYRSDVFGENLNRVYLEPSLSESPTIYAARELLTSYCAERQDRVYAYIDLHGHAAKQGVFVYGNFMEYVRQVDSFMFPKLMSLNCANFDLSNCSFSERNMRAQDKRDGKSKEGSGRVAFFKLAGLVRSYTLEANYATGKTVNSVADCALDEPRREGKSPPQYNVPIFEDVGKAIGVSLLDSIEANPESRLKLSGFTNLKALKTEVARYVAKQTPFRFDPFLRKADAEKLMAFIESGGVPPKEESKDSGKPPRNSQAVKRKINDLARPRRLRQPEPKEGSLGTILEAGRPEEFEKLRHIRKERSVVSPILGMKEKKGKSFLRQRNARSLSQHRQLEGKYRSKPSLS
jgi:hypothetical protein